MLTAFLNQSAGLGGSNHGWGSIVIRLLKAAKRYVDGIVESPYLARAIGEAFFRVPDPGAVAECHEFLQARRILVVRLDGIGDVVLTSAFLRQARSGWPQARITLLVHPSVLNLVETCPYVDEILVFDGRPRGLLRRGVKPWRLLAMARRELFRRQFDLAINPRPGVDCYHATHLVYFSGAKRRVAFSKQVSPTRRRSNHDWDLLLTDALLGDGTEHEAGCHAEMLRFLGVAAGGPQLELWPSDGDRQFAAGMLARHGLAKGRPVVALGIGAGERKRVWPLKRFLAVADWLRRERDALILLVGGAMEAPAAVDFARAFGSGLVDVVGRATLRETTALLEECELYVGNDTGVMHMAVAAGAMVVEISCHPQGGSRMHANSPVRFGPVGVPSRVLQPREAIPPCSGFCQSNTTHCIEGVSVEEVQQAVEALFTSACVRRVPPARSAGGTHLSENRKC